MIAITNSLLWVILNLRKAISGYNEVVWEFPSTNLPSHVEDRKSQKNIAPLKQ